VGARSVGVEEEFLLFEADASRLVDVGAAVVDAASADDDAQFEKELMKAQAELGSAPTTRLADLARELSERRGELVRAARGRGARLVASGTCPVPGHTATTDERRYQQMATRFAATLRRQLTCAMHVHVDVDSPEEGVRVLNGLGRWLPALIALTANSPFHAGRDTGYSSYRRSIWGEWPTSGVAGPFADRDDYAALVRRLITTGAARDDGMIYFDARLSARYPTVEIRVSDVRIDVEDAVTIAGLCRALVNTAAAEESAPVPRSELLSAASWRAARWGMTDQLVDLHNEPALVPAWDLIDALLDHVGAALDATGDQARIADGLAHIRERGTGAQRQRQAANGDPARAIDVATVSE
jgi:carboxylate-amine ligase